MYDSKIKQYFLIGKEYLEMRDIYTVPCQSSLLNIYKVNDLSNNYKMWSVDSVTCKYFCYDIPGINSIAAFPIPHTEKCNY